MASNGSFSIGTAHRTRVQMTPVIHILVPVPYSDTPWAMWCSGSKGREDNPHGNRLCSECRQLAHDALAEQMLDPSEVGERWFTEEQLAEAAADA